MSLIFVDVEAEYGSPCPGIGGGMTEFGAVEFESYRRGEPSVFYASRAYDWREMFLEFEQWLHTFPPHYVFVSDNVAYDWQWINYHFHHTIGRNPFGHSGRRISDFYAGLMGEFRQTQRWKRLRITKHTHHPVDDAMGNAQAFERLLRGER